MKLSIGMIVKNEEEHLEECLESLNPIRKAIDSELIIVDTGSEDNTVEIAKKYTDKVYFHEWTGHFAEMRNKTVDYAQGDWYFFIDGDEIIENPDQIINFLQSDLTEEINSASVEIKNILTEDNISIATAIRLCKNTPDFKFEGKVHERPQFKVPFAALDTTLKHYGYLSTDEELMERKFERNSKLLKEELEGNPENIYLWFQLSQTYSMHGDSQEALETIAKAYNIAQKNNIDLKNKMYVYDHYSRMLLSNKQYQQAEEICKEGLTKRDDHIDLRFYSAKAQAKLDKNKEAVDNFKKYLELVKDYDNSSLKNDLTYIAKTLDKVEVAYHDLCVLNNKLENYDQVLHFAWQIEAEKLIKKVIPLVIKACFESEQYSKIKEYYREIIEPKDQEMINKFLTTLESKMLNCEAAERKKVIQLFTDLDNEYSILNNIRQRIQAGNQILDESLIANIEELPLNSLPNYYGDILYYLLQLEFPFVNLSISVLERFLQYLFDKYDDVSRKILNYLRGQDFNKDINVVRVNKTLCKYALGDTELETTAYQELFNRYIMEGNYYLSQLYTQQIIQNEMIDHLKNDEDKFLLYMYLANQIKQQDEAKYVRYLRKALNVYPAMKPGIELLLERVKEENNSEEQKRKNQEFEEHKETVRKQISSLIDEGKLEEAKVLLEQYEDIVSDDPEVYSMKSIIAIMEERLEEAEEILQTGLKINKNDFDLLYNLGYVHSLRGKEELALKVYKQALQVAPSQELKEEILDLVEELDVEGDIDIPLEEFSDDSFRPVFVGGAGRSGTTLMRVMLNAHRNLCAGPEFKMLPNIADLYNQILKLKEIRKAYYLEDEVVNNIFADFIASFFEEFKEKSSAKRLVEKTPHNVLAMKELGQIFPEAKFIHVIRDGRDVARSLQNMDWKDFEGNPLPYVQNIENASKYWRDIVTKAISIAQTAGINDRVKI